MFDCDTTLIKKYNNNNVIPGFKTTNNGCAKHVTTYAKIMFEDLFDASDYINHRIGGSSYLE